MAALPHRQRAGDRNAIIVEEGKITFADAATILPVGFYRFPAGRRHRQAYLSRIDCPVPPTLGWLDIGAHKHTRGLQRNGYINPNAQYHCLQHRFSDHSYVRSGILFTRRGSQGGRHRACRASFSQTPGTGGRRVYSADDGIFLNLPTCFPTAGGSAVSVRTKTIPKKSKN